MHLEKVSRVRRLFALALFPTFVFLAGFLFQTSSPDAVHENPPEGLKPVKMLPEGIRVTSGQKDLRIDISPTTQNGQPGSVDFCIVLPASASLTPEVLDYRLVRSAGPDEAPRPAPRDLRRIGALAIPGSPTSETLPQITPAEEKRAKLTTSESIRRLVAVEDQGIIRFYRVIRVKLQFPPIEVPLHGTYAVDRVSIRFPFSKPVSNRSPLAETTADWGFARVLRHLVANPEALPLYADRSQGQPNTAPEQAGHGAALSQLSGGTWLRIGVRKDGLVRITSDHLTSAGLKPESVDPHAIRVFSRGKEVPSLLIGTKGSRFTPEDGVVFYGRASESPYSLERAYWVNIGASEAPNALRMPIRKRPENFDDSKPSYITTLQERLFEEDKELSIQHGNFLSIKGKQWVWTAIAPEASTEIPFDLPEYDSRSTATIPLQVRFYLAPPESGGSPAYSDIPLIVLRVNDSFTTTLPRFSGPEDNIRKLEVPAKCVAERGNVLSLKFEIPYKPTEDQSVVYLDNFTARYWRALIARGGQLQAVTRGGQPWYRAAGFTNTFPLLFDLTEPERPELLDVQNLSSELQAFYEPRSDRKLFAILPSSIDASCTASLASDHKLSSPDNEADYLIIYHPRFTEEIKPLIKLHQDQGMKVRAVDINDIYEEYSWGELTPHAIKDFLYDALRLWRVPPTYVCLFGDASSDYRDELRSGVPNLVPAYSYDAQTDDRWASELWYATLLGNDLFPDILLGRISAQHVDDAKEMVRKVVDYTTKAPMGPWRSRIGYCADDSGFRDATQSIYQNYRPNAIGNERIFLEEMSYDDNFYLSKDIVAAKDMKVSTAATVKLLETYDRGIGLMTYFGHGSPNLWTDERIWFGGDSPNSDNLNLRNGDRLPFVNTFTCNHGAFDYPMPRWDVSISEDMLRVKKGGAVGLFVPAGPGVTATHEQVAESFYQALFRENLRRIGEVEAWTDITYLMRGGPPEMIRMFVLLCDPALDLAIPVASEEGSITPATVSRVDLLRDQELVLEGKTEGVGHGGFVASLYDPDDQEVSHSERLKFSGGAIRYKFRLPATARYGTWTVRIYYANDSSRKDGCLAAKVLVTRPVLAIKSLALSKTPPKPGENVDLVLEVQNEYGTKAEGVPIRVVREDANGRQVVMADQKIDVGAKGLHLLRGHWTAEAGLYSFKATIGRFALPLNDQATPRGEKVVTVHIPSTTTTSLLTIPSLAKRTWRSYSPTSDISLEIPLYYSDMRERMECRASLLDSKGTAVTTAGLTLGDPIRVDGHAELGMQIAVPKEILAKSYRLVVSTMKMPERKLLDVAIPLGAPTVADLVVVPGSVRFIPPVPTEGETVFARMQVQNEGLAMSDLFSIHVSTVDNRDKLTDGIPLYSKPDLSQLEQQPLAPGRLRDVTVRWDYGAWKDCAGTSTIRFRLNAGSGALSPDAKGNYLDAPLRILSRPNMKVVNLERKSRDIDSQFKELTLTATIKNMGETPALNRHLGFFNHLPRGADDLANPKVLVKDIQLPTVRGGEQMQYSNTWKVDYTDPDSSPTAEVYRPTQAIRSGAAEVKIAPEW